MIGPARGAGLGLAALGVLALIGSGDGDAAGRRAPAHITAVLPGSTLESGTLVGRSGQLYVPAESGGWRRAGRGGVACDVHAAMKLGGEVWAVCARAPLFRFSGDTWSAAPLSNRGRSRGQASGTLAVVSVGRHLYVWKDGSGWVRDSSAPGRIVSLHAESPTRMYAVTSRHELIRRSGSAWRTVVSRPRSRRPEPETAARLFGSERYTYAVTHGGSLAMVAGSGLVQLQLPEGASGLTVDAAAAGERGAVLVAGTATSGGTARPAIAVLRGNTVEVAPAPPLADGERAGVLHAQDGKLLLATRRGRVFVRGTDGTWTEQPLETAPEEPERELPATARPAHTR